MPRRLLTRSAVGRRLWWQTRGRRSELQFWAAWLAGSEGAEEWASDRERRFTPDTEVGDPLLRREIERLLEAAGLEPPVRTLPVAREALLDRFGARRFDIAHASNFLDHSVDPLRIITNMVAVVRAGGSVILRHARSEGHERRYEGLHQWNFDVAEGDLIVWNSVTTVNVSSALRHQATVESWIEPHDQQDHVLARLVVVVNGTDLALRASA